MNDTKKRAYMSGCNTQYIPFEQIERQNQDICSENNLLNGVHRQRIFCLLSDSRCKKKIDPPNVFLIFP